VYPFDDFDPVTWIYYARSLSLISIRKMQTWNFVKVGFFLWNGIVVVGLGQCMCPAGIGELRQLNPSQMRYDV
jgi:hypothetical protein